jgi:hypothetical protein
MPRTVDASLVLLMHAAWHYGYDIKPHANGRPVSALLNVALTSPHPFSLPHSWDCHSMVES